MNKWLEDNIAVSRELADGGNSGYFHPATRGIARLGTAAVALTLAACGGGGGVAVTPQVEVSVVAVHPDEGPDWNDYVNSLGTACEAGLDDTCVHGGELRTVLVTDKTGCNELTAEDALGVFDWLCVVDGDEVRMVSSGLRNGKRLSDLIDFDAAAWKTNSVTVYDDGEAWLTTAATMWWGNPVVVNNDASEMDEEGTIYLITEASAGVYEINADKVGIVVRPGVVLKPSSNTDLFAIGTQAPHDYLWIEGTVDAEGAGSGVTVRDSRFSTIRGLTVMNSDEAGVLLEDLFFSRVSAVTALHGDNDGILLSFIDENTISDLVAINNGQYGIHVTNSARNLLKGIRTSNNQSAGLYLDDATDNVLIGITASGNSNGIRLAGATNNMLSDALAVNNSSDGISLVSSSDDNTLSRIAVVNNGIYGFEINSSDGNTLDGVAAARNEGTGIRLHNNANTVFTGPLRLANEVDCNVTFIGDPVEDQGVDGDCANVGDSDADLATGLFAAVLNIFVGKAGDDAVNADHTEGVAEFPAEPDAFDWTQFENGFRAWGKENVANFPDSGHRGLWTAGAGRIWDWSLRDEDSFQYEVLAIPHGNDTLSHTWSDASETAFLRNAIELAGNGNGLCESDEDCLYSPNLGSYQGHGDVVRAGEFGGGAITGVRRFRFETNGYTTEPIIPES
jgi:parallel beta-helix repeat protein